jgi:hypothetical protein
MSGEGNVILVQRFKKPSGECDRRTYRDYVRQILAHDLTIPECQDLCRLFVCGIEELETKLVNQLFGKKG